MPQHKVDVDAHEQPYSFHGDDMSLDAVEGNLIIYRGGQQVDRFGDYEGREVVGLFAPGAWLSATRTVMDSETED